MKKFLLFFTMLIVSVAAAFAQDDNDGWKTATEFNWKTGNVQAANTTVWHKVVLEGEVAEGENVLLYLNNLEATAANVEVTVYTVVTKVIYGEEQVSVQKLEGPESKAIAANRNYAYEIGGSIIKNFNLKTVYIKLKTDRQLKFSAEPVEPGEKDTECLNATKLTVPGTLNYTNLNKNTWYQLDLKDVKADNTKTVKVTITNTGSAVANLKAGVSFDCPSTGVTEESTKLAIDQVKTKVLDRKYLDMLAEDTIYLRVNSDVRVKIEAQIVANTEPVTYTDVVSPIDLDMETVYTQNAGVTQWYSVDLKKCPGKLLPEVSVENKENAKATVDAIVVYETHASAYADRSFTLGAKAIKVQQIERNVVNNAIKMTAEKQGVDTGIVYVRITTDRQIEFMARMKKRTEGDACAQSKEFDWTNGNKQSGNTTIWYAIDITDAKAATNKDIQLSITNKSSKDATVSGKVAFECPYTSTTDATRTVKANKTETRVLKRSLYSHLAHDTIYVGLTTSQNIDFRADLVDADVSSLDDACKTSTFFNAKDVDEQGVSKQTLAIPAGVNWYKVSIKDLRSMEQVPEVHVKNQSDTKATVRVDVALDCPCDPAGLQHKTQTIAGNETYVNTPSSDLLKSLDENTDTAWVRVETDQPLTAFTKLVYEDEGASCAKATNFNWTSGETYEPDAAHWYAVDIKKAKDEQKNIRITLKNLTSKDAKVKAEIAFECPVSSTTAYNYTSPAGSVKTKDLTYSMFETVKSDVVYIKLTADQKLEIKAELVEDDSPVIDICAKNPIAYDWVAGIDQLFDPLHPTDTTWYYLPLDTFEKDNYALVPKVTVYNLGANKVNLKGIAAFKCQVKSPMSRTMSIAAGGKYEKNAERDMMKQYTDPATKDTLYFGIVADQDIHFEIEFMNPDQGQDCMHAIDFDWINGNHQEGNDTVWYKVDIRHIKDKPNTSARIGLKNTDGFTGKVVADMFFTCDDEKPFTPQQSYTLHANDDKKYELGRELFTNMAVDYILIRLFAAQDIFIYAEEYATEPEVIVPINGCDTAKHITYNFDIAQSEDSVWYVVDIKDIKQNTTGDAVLTVKNTDATEAKISVSLTYSCPVVEKMIDKSITLAPGATYEKTATRSLINNTSADTAWILVVTDRAITFRVDLIDDRGKSCSTPIEFDWVNGNDHPGMDTLWYEVSLDTVKNDELKRDMRLTLENLVAPTSTNVKADLFFDCPGPSETEDDVRQTSQTYTLTDASKSKDITRAFLENAGWPKLFIKYTSTNNTHLQVSLIDPLPPVKDTTHVYDTICAGRTDYKIVGIDPNNVQKDSLQAPLFADTLIYLQVAGVDSFSVKYNDTEMKDSLVFHHVAVRTVPVIWRDYKIADKPVVAAGKAIDVASATATATATIKALEDQLHNELDTIVFEVQDPVTKAFSAVTPALLPTNTKDVSMRYVATFKECSEALAFSDTIVIQATAPQYFTKSFDENVCSGFTFTRRNNAIVTVDENYDPSLYNDTVEFVLTEGVELADSVFVYNYQTKVLPSKQAVTVLPTATCGGGVTLAAATADLKTKFTPTGRLAAIDTIKWEYLNGVDFVDLTEDVMFSTDQKQITVRYVALSECADYALVTGDEVVITVADDCQRDTAVWTDTVCSGSSVEFFDGATVITETITADQLDRTYAYKYKAADGREADSVNVYNYYVYHTLTLPQLSTLDAQPKAVCGEEVELTETVKELQDELDAAVAADKLVAPVVQVKWEVKDVNGNWVEMSSQPTIDPSMNTIDVRYQVTTDCEVVEDQLTIDVQKRTSESLKSIKKYTAISRYNGWLLMVDQKNLQIDYPTLDSTMVKWYKVVSQNDVVAPAEVGTANEDIFLGTGWYYTEGKALTGEYYARIDFESSAAEPCGETVLSETITITSPSGAPQLSPTVVAPHETLYLSSLNADTKYLVSIYDLLGNLIDRKVIEGVESYTFEAQESVGYYMLNIESDAVKETFKYIVK